MRDSFNQMMNISVHNALFSHQNEPICKKSPSEGRLVHNFVASSTEFCYGF